MTYFNVYWTKYTSCSDKPALCYVCLRVLYVSTNGVQFSQTIFSLILVDCDDDDNGCLFKQWSTKMDFVRIIGYRESEKISREIT